LRRALNWFLRIVTRSGDDEARAAKQHESLVWPQSMKDVTAVWTPSGYVLHRTTPDGALETVPNNRARSRTGLGLPGYGGTPPGVGYG
jgi:hypothetical protein